MVRNHKLNLKFFLFTCAELERVENIVYFLSYRFSFLLFLHNAVKISNTFARACRKRLEYLRVNGGLFIKNDLMNLFSKNLSGLRKFRNFIKASDIFQRAYDVNLEYYLIVLFSGLSGFQIFSRFFRIFFRSQQFLVRVTGIGHVKAYKDNCRNQLVTERNVKRIVAIMTSLQNRKCRKC